MFEVWRALEENDHFEWFKHCVGDRLYDKYPHFCEEAVRIFEEKRDLLDCD